MGGTTQEVTVEAIDASTAAAWGSDAAATYATVMTQQNTWQSALATIIGTYGFIRQAQALDRQVDLQERMVDNADDYLALAQQSFQEITRDAYLCQKSLFERYKADLEQCVDEFLLESKRLTEHAPEYVAAEGRAVMSVRRAMDRARRKRALGRSKYALGACCHESIWFDTEQARLEVNAANAAYDSERTLKFRLDEFYWQRQTVGAQLVENYRTHVISGVNSGTTNVANGLNAIGGAVSASTRAGAQLGDAIRDQASFFGTLSNGAFRFAGFSAGYAQAGNAPVNSWYAGTGGGTSLFNTVAGQGGIDASQGLGLLNAGVGNASAFGFDGMVPGRAGNGVGLLGLQGINSGGAA